MKKSIIEDTLNESYSDNDIKKELYHSSNVPRTFKDWKIIIFKRCELITIQGIEGELDNAQYIPELVPLILL